MICLNNSLSSRDHGTVFRVTTSGALTTLVLFNYRIKGMSPQSALVPGADGDCQ